MSSPHSHAHHGEELGTTRLVIAIGLNVAITVAEVAAGLLAGSLALLADAAHNLNDAASLGITWGARKMAQKDPDRQRTFGYRRAEVLGAFVNLVALVLIAFFLLKEAAERYWTPQPVDGTLMMVVAGGALLANVGTAALLYRGASNSLNIESAFVHIVADALASVGVVAGGGLVLGYGWTGVDSVLTAVISSYILWQSAGLLRRTSRILMESAPPGFDFEGMVAAMEAVDEVCGVHHVHVWQLDEHRTAVEAHVVLDESDLGAMEAIKARLKERLAIDFDVGHATLEFEIEPCGAERAVVGH